MNNPAQPGLLLPEGYCGEAAIAKGDINCQLSIVNCQFDGRFLCSA